MKKHIRLAQLSSLITSMILLIVTVYLILNKGDNVGVEGSGNVGEIGKLQIDQGQKIESLQTQYDQKIEIQNNLLTEYDLKMKELENMQTELTKNVSDMQENLNKSMTTPSEQTTEATPIEQEQEVEVEIPQQENKTLTINSADGLNLRNTASSDGGSLELIPNGSQVTILEGPQFNGGYNWYKVQTGNGNVGWIAKEFTLE